MTAAAPSSVWEHRKTYLMLAPIGAPVAIRPTDVDVFYPLCIAQFVGLCPNGTKSEVFFEDEHDTCDVPTSWVYVTQAALLSHAETMKQICESK